MKKILVSLLAALAVTFAPFNSSLASVSKPDTTIETIQFKQNIQFGCDSTKLDPTQVISLSKVLELLLIDKSYNVKIEGHTSSEGQAEHNNKLSQQRADVVRDFLIANGVEGHRLTAIGFGSQHPIADNKTEAGRIANRRVVFDVVVSMEK